MLCELSNGWSFLSARRYSSDVTDARSWNLPQYYSTLSFADIDADGKSELCGRSSIGRRASPVSFGLTGSESTPRVAFGLRTG